MQISADGQANAIDAGDAHQGDEPHPESAYLDELDRHMSQLVRGNVLLNNSKALPLDTQPLVDYWLPSSHRSPGATSKSPSWLRS